MPKNRVKQGITSKRQRRRSPGPPMPLPVRIGLGVLGLLALGISGALQSPQKTTADTLPQDSDELVYNPQTDSYEKVAK